MVTDSSCDQAGGGMSLLQVFILALPPQSKQSPTGMLGFPLKQVVDGLEGVPGKQSKPMKTRRGQLVDWGSGFRIL